MAVKYMCIAPWWPLLYLGRSVISPYATPPQVCIFQLMRSYFITIVLQFRPQSLLTKFMYKAIPPVYVSASCSGNPFSMDASYRLDNFQARINRSK